MTLTEIKKYIESTQYSFLRDNENLGRHLAIVTLGGSHAYGTNNENSDLDIRGIALNSKKDILVGQCFEQFVSRETDTVIYSFNKMLTLLTNCNPNTIELLGNKPEHYLYVSEIGQEILDHTKLFLSKRCIHSFGGYATAQLRRLENKAARLVSQSEKEKHILETIESARYFFEEHYGIHNIELYIDKAQTEGLDKEVYVNANIQGYPLRKYTGLIQEMNSIVRSYDKVGMRNSKAIEHNKLGKHMMHLLRLYMMCIDMLEQEKVITYREQEHDLLMDIRNGVYLDENRQPKSEFFDILNEYEKRFEYAKNHTSLPEEPDYKAIEEFKYSVNERVVLTYSWR